MRSTDSPFPSGRVRTKARDGKPPSTARLTVSGVPTSTTWSPGETLRDEA